MGALLNPVGPESVRTYWIRRGVVALVAVLLLWGLIAMFSPKPNTPAAAPALTPTPTVSVSLSVSAPPVSPTATSSAPASVTPTASATTPAGPAACDPGIIQSVIAGFRSVTVGTKQVFSLTLTNNSPLTCLLDLSPNSYVVKVSSGADRIWTTADCPKAVPTKAVTLQPGDKAEFSLSWNLKRSQPTCKSAKTALGPGTYVASATYAETAVGRFVMQLVKQ